MPRPAFVGARLDDLSLGGNQAFIYVIAAAVGDQVFFYVGQTRQRMGALGRLAEHLSEGENATFRQRVWDVAKLDLQGAVHFAAVELSRERAFQRACPDYREAVECLIESRLREHVVRKRILALSVARVRLHAYRTSPIAMREAQRSAAALERWLETAVSQLRGSS
jgi:hypothetical protein